MSDILERYGQIHGFNKFKSERPDLDCVIGYVNGWDGKPMLVTFTLSLIADENDRMFPSTVTSTYSLETLEEKGVYRILNELAEDLPKYKLYRDDRLDALAYSMTKYSADMRTYLETLSKTISDLAERVSYLEAGIQRLEQAQDNADYHQEDNLLGTDISGRKERKNEGIHVR